MSTFQSLVVGIDFSDSSKSALEEALRLARLDGGKVHAVQAVGREALEEQLQYHRIAAEQAVERIHAHLIRHLATEGAGELADANVVVGNPALGLIEVAERCHADLLVVGARGWEHRLPGSVGAVAAKCVRRSPVPVLVVRRRHHGPFRRVLACTDFSATARLALGRAIHLAAREGAALDVLHVDFPLWLQPPHVQYDMQALPDADYQEQYRAGLHDQLGKHLRELSPPADLEVKCHVREDTNPADAIVTFARESGADLVVLGTAGRTGLGAFLLGTTAERILHRSGCSVLAVKPPRPAAT